MKRTSLVLALILSLVSMESFAGGADVKIGEVPALPDTRFCRRHVRIEKKSCHRDVSVRFGWPTERDITASIRDCALASAGVALGAGIALTPAAGIAVFKPAFLGCMASKAPDLVSHITMDMRAPQVCGKYPGH